MLVKLTALVGVLFLLVSFYVLVPFVRACVGGADGTSVVMPVSLRPGTIVTPSFRTLFDHSDCQVDIELDARVDNIVRSASGVPMFQYSVGPIECTGGPHCSPLGSLLDISWQLQSNGKTIAEGNSHEWDRIGEAFSGRIIHGIGLFKVKGWHTYRVVLHINRDASALNEADPRVIVSRPSAYDERNYLGVFVGGPIVLVSGLIGLALIYPAAKRWRSQRKSQ